MYVYGKNVAKELIRNNKKITKAYLMNDFKDDEILDGLKKFNVIPKYMDKKNLDRIDNGNHQGIIIEIEDYKYIEEKQMLNNLPENPFIVVLDHLEDTHNFGAIIRTCEAAGVDYIIIPKNRSVSVNSTVYKTSSGALNNVKIVEVVNLSNTIRKLQDLGYWVYGAEANGVD